MMIMLNVVLYLLVYVVVFLFNIRIHTFAMGKKRKISDSFLTDIFYGIGYGYGESNLMISN